MCLPVISHRAQHLVPPGSAASAAVGASWPLLPHGRPRCRCRFQGCGDFMGLSMIGYVGLYICVNGSMYF